MGWVESFVKCVRSRPAGWLGHVNPNPDGRHTHTTPTQIINDARELLRRGEWDAGVLLAVRQMEAWILQGPPGFWERHSGAWVYVFIVYGGVGV